MKSELRDLYNRLEEMEEYYYQYLDIQSEIESFKDRCEHIDNIVLEEGTEFDGYDRNEYYALIYCRDCDSRFFIYSKGKAKGFNFVEGVTKYNCRR